MDDLLFDERFELDITYRNRPHWKQQGKIHFVTWRLADSLAQVQLEELERDRKAWLLQHGKKPIGSLEPLARREYYRLFHERVERWLDADAGSCVLRLPGPRKEMVETLHIFAGSRYRLGTFAVAGNHVHVLVVPNEGVDLSSVTHSWKSYTAKSINKLLGRTGRLWKDESFDHIVRSEASYWKLDKYIRAHVRQGAYVEERSLLG
jgi:putative transposase